jgi:NAD dependent epimerase/dehydratase family enzyme
MEMNNVADRVAVLRTGVVFDPAQGAYPKLIKPVKMGLPVILGSGHQFISWIATEDIARMYRFVLERNLKGIFNAVAPESPRFKDFMECVSLIYNKNCCLPPVPKWILKLIMGESACLITEGMPISSKKIRNEGFIFEYDRLEKLVRHYKKWEART